MSRFRDARRSIGLTGVTGVHKVVVKYAATIILLDKSAVILYLFLIYYIGRNRMFDKDFKNISHTLIVCAHG